MRTCVVGVVVVVVCVCMCVCVCVCVPARVCTAVQHFKSFGLNKNHGHSASFSVLLDTRVRADISGGGSDIVSGGAGGGRVGYGRDGCCCGGRDCDCGGEEQHLAWCFDASSLEFTCDPTCRILCLANTRVGQRWVEPAGE